MRTLSRKRLDGPDLRIFESFQLHRVILKRHRVHLLKQRLQKILDLFIERRLDDELAEGRAPESSRLLATRAQLIVSPTFRQKMADNWLALLVQAREPSGPLTMRVPLVRSRIIGAQAQILALADALLAPMPTSRGVAMASSLLGDGSGPIYYSECSTDLGSTVLEIVARLDPKAA